MATPRDIVDFSTTPDVQRILGTPASPEGYDPEVNPPIVDPSAKSYANQIRERAESKKATQGLKGKAPPLGHVAPPPPEKMAAIAGLSGPVQPNFSDPGAQPPPPPTPAPSPQPVPMVQGVGAAYPVNQAMARGQVNRPVTLREANQMTQAPSFSPGTVQALQMANENAKNPGPPPPPEETPSVAEEAKKEIEAAEEALAPEVPLLDFGALQDARSVLMTKARRKEIEARLSPLDIGDMIMKRELTQDIPVVPGKFEVRLRTFSQRENIWVLKYVYNFPGSTAYVQELVNTFRLVCSVVAINGAYLPDHRKNVGQMNEDVDTEMFEKKMFHVASFPTQLVADMAIQSIWFQSRVDKLFTIETLKNG